MEISTEAQRIIRSVQQYISKNKQVILIAGSALLITTGGVYQFMTEKQESYFEQSPTEIVEDEFTELGAFPVIVPNIKYGFALDTFQVKTVNIVNGKQFTGLLLEAGIPSSIIDQLVRKSKGVFNVNSIRGGRTFEVLTRFEGDTPDHVVYEPNNFEYIIFNLKGTPSVQRIKREIEVSSKSGHGIVNSSLWDAMVDNGMSFEVADKMEDALRFSVDFHHLKRGDEFYLVYDEQYIDAKKVGVGRVNAACYKTGGKTNWAIYYNKEGHEGYYDIDGRPLKKGFLSAPVKYSRISSKFNLKRFHPVLKYTRPHLGTDYAAPHGTPIMSVGDGTVVERAYSRGNGNFVKVKHDKTYQTQYLHMSRFAKNIKVGSRVAQGEVIGYVGSTGLATGPHVCFRFWKNGKQVNPLNEKMPPAKPLPISELPSFLAQRDAYLQKMGLNSEVGGITNANTRPVKP